jgi:hypothetical protein
MLKKSKILFSFVLLKVVKNCYMLLCKFLINHLVEQKFSYIKLFSKDCIEIILSQFIFTTHYLKC